MTFPRKGTGIFARWVMLTRRRWWVFAGGFIVLYVIITNRLIKIKTTALDNLAKDKPVIDMEIFRDKQKMNHVNNFQFFDGNAGLIGNEDLKRNAKEIGNEGSNRNDGKIDNDGLNRNAKRIDNNGLNENAENNDNIDKDEDDNENEGGSKNDAGHEGMDEDFSNDDNMEHPELPEPHKPQHHKVGLEKSKEGIVDLKNGDEDNLDLHKAEPKDRDSVLKAKEIADDKSDNQKEDEDEDTVQEKRVKHSDKEDDDKEKVGDDTEHIESANKRQSDLPKLVFGSDGPGQNGDGFHVDKNKLTREERRLYDRGFERNDFNEYVSDLISVDRSPPDIQRPECMKQTFPTDLPDTSVIITFLNEAFSVLVRSVHSVINQSPPYLLREIILVDDFSDYDVLRGPLDEHLKMLPKVKILRNTQREGLIRSRLKGAAMASGKVLTFLDSHIECAKGWLEPLLARIKENRSNVVLPSMPDINNYIFKFNVNGEITSVGGFTWALQNSWEYPPLQDRKSALHPVRSPAMHGGVFSIDKDYFFHIGSFDDQMTFMGAENLEISFRIWMCGGTIEILPCSVVAHIYRNRNVNANSNNTVDTKRNTLRTAMVWMDEYKYLYFNVADVQPKDYGDITSRLELREKLECKDFEWYLNNVYTSIFRPDNAVMSGLLHSVADPSRCLQIGPEFHSNIITGPCNKTAHIQQLFYETSFEELRTIAMCVDAGLHPRVITFECSRSKGNQHIRIEKDGRIYVPSYDKCLEWLTAENEVQLRPCDKDNSRQLWKWEKHEVDFMKKKSL